MTPLLPRPTMSRAGGGVSGITAEPDVAGHLQRACPPGQGLATGDLNVPGGLQHAGEVVGVIGLVCALGLGKRHRLRQAALMYERRELAGEAAVLLAVYLLGLTPLLHLPESRLGHALTFCWHGQSP